MYTTSFLNFNNLLISFLYTSKVVPIFFSFFNFISISPFLRIIKYFVSRDQFLYHSLVIEEAQSGSR